MFLVFVYFWVLTRFCSPAGVKAEVLVWIQKETSQVDDANVRGSTLDQNSVKTTGVKLSLPGFQAVNRARAARQLRTELQNHQVSTLQSSDTHTWTGPKGSDPVLQFFPEPKLFWTLKVVLDQQFSTLHEAFSLDFSPVPGHS